MTHVRAAALAGGTLALTLVLSACGGSGGTSAAGGMDHSGSSTGSSTVAQAPAGDHNDADVEFAQSMVVHHRGAIEMASLATARTEDPEVKALAERIQAAQDPEIQTMTGWLEAWGAEVPEGTTPVDGAHHGGAMPGMLDEHAMADLEAATGPEFDRLFLEGMTVHHRGAIEMAHTEQADGRSAEAVALAEQIEADQTVEIEEMQRLLAAL